MNENSEDVTVSRVALRLPPFWRSNVKLWLIQCEHSFGLSGITNDETKYSALVTSIDAETLSHVSDLVSNPPETGKYKALADRLLLEFGDSENQKAKKLLTELQLGDQKPSQLLRKMRELSAGQLTDEFLKSLWLQRLPTQIQAVLSASSENLTQMANLADKVAEVIQQPVPVYAVASDENLPGSSTAIAQLTEQVKKLTLQVEHLSREHHRQLNNFRNRPYRSSSQSRQRRQPQPNGSTEICYYHAKFGDKAYKCISPCTFTKQEKN